VYLLAVSALGLLGQPTDYSPDLALGTVLGTNSADSSGSAAVLANRNGNSADDSDGDNTNEGTADAATVTLALLDLDPGALLRSAEIGCSTSGSSTATPTNGDDTPISGGLEPDWYQALLAYTLSPVASVAAMALVIAGLVCCRGKAQQKVVTTASANRAVSRAGWLGLCVLFVVYPGVAVAIVR